MKLSIIIKTFNEGANIARSVESAIAATRGMAAEIIVADSLSTDATVDIARRYPITVIQLTDPADRSCGVGAQLGFQHCGGEYVFILDGDMALDPDFFPRAMEELEADTGLAGVAGQVCEESISLEYRLRTQRGDPTMTPGLVNRLHSGGLYRRSALQAVGYFTDPNLHSFEEFELGMRLGAAGWRLRRLAIPGVWHRGHEIAAPRLLRSRWRTRYAFGPGELLRAARGHRYFSTAVHEVRLMLIVIGWWIVLAALAGLALARPGWLAALGVVAATPPVYMVVKKKSVRLGLYAVAAWFVLSAGLVAGYLSERRDPQRRIPARVLKR